MQTYRCLKKEAKTSGKVFLSASAGTGKTFAIEHVVARKILSGCSIEEILVVTFTREATRSLKRRIHKTLLESIALLDADAKEPEHMIEYIFEYCPKEARANALRAIANLDQAQVFTIHGFCLEMLNRHSLKESLVLASQNLDQISEAQARINEAIFTLLRQAEALDFSLSQKSLFIEQSNKDLHKLIETLKPLLFSKDKLKKTRSFKEIEGDFLNELGAQTYSEDKVLADLEELKKGFKGIFDMKGQLQSSLLVQVKALTEKNFDELLLESKSLFSYFDENNKKARFAIAIEQLNYPTLYFQKGQALTSLIQEARNIELLNHRFSFLMQDRFDQHGNLFFADKLLTMMQGALDDPIFLKRVQQSFKAVIIDEFQDTDQLQYHIFKTLFYNQEDIFFCVVGDEKQSIYAFRGADLNTYNGAREDFKDSQFRLDANFRSSKGMIHGLERLFSGFESQAKDDIAFDFYKVHAMAENVENLEPSLEFFLREKKEQQALLEDIYQRVVALKKEHGFKNSSFVFLVKDRYQAEKVYDFLKGKGQEADALIRDSIFNSSAFLWIMLLLEFIDTRTNALKKALLVHPMVGLKADLFHDSEPSLRLIRAFDELDTIAQAFKKGGLHASFSQALNACLYEDGITFEEGLVGKQMMQELFDLKKVMQLVLSLSLEKALVITDLIEKLNCVIRSNRTEPEYLKDVSSSSDCILIMTQHASKGLEFDVVVAMGLMLESSSKKKFQKDEALALDQEKMRLFYVTLTRAKQKLLIPCTFRDKQSAVPLAKASAMDLFMARRLGYAAYETMYERVQSLDYGQIVASLKGFHIHESVSTEKVEQQDLKVALVKPKLLTHLKHERVMHSFSSLYHSKQFLDVGPLDEDVKGGKWFGSLVHKLLEKILSKGFHSPFNESLIQELIERYLKFTPLKEDSQRLFEMVKTSLHKPLDQGLRLVDVKKENMHQEACFLMNQESQRDLKGFVDLVFFHKESVYIIDYKTHHLPNYSAKMCQKVVGHYQYDQQMKLYKKAVAQYLQERGLGERIVEARLVFVRARQENEGIVRVGV